MDSQKKQYEQNSNSGNSTSLAKTSSQNQVGTRQNKFFVLLQRLYKRMSTIIQNNFNFFMFLLSIGIYFAAPFKVDYDIVNLKGFIKRNGGIKKENTGNQGMRPY